ncbi:MAG: hypothetical protein IIX90_02540 [Clostridia bacterium]|nr:hypothetical protein [Clostridia bacterium]
MKEKLTEHIRLLFADAERRSPDNRQLAELKEELLLNTLEKYDHMLETGRTPEAAYALAVSGIGDIEGLLNDVIGEAPASEKACEAMPAVETATPAIRRRDLARTVALTKSATKTMAKTITKTTMRTARRTAAKSGRPAPAGTRWSAGSSGR